jgi:hypothetical protein
LGQGGVGGRRSARQKNTARLMRVSRGVQAWSLRGLGRSTQPRPLDPVYRAPRRSWHRTLRRQRRRQLRQRARGDDQRPLQSRSDLAARTVALDGSR